MVPFLQTLWSLIIVFLAIVWLWSLGEVAAAGAALVLRVGDGVRQVLDGDSDEDIHDDDRGLAGRNLQVSFFYRDVI